jgi:putative zinc finger protein
MPVMPASSVTARKQLRPMSEVRTIDCEEALRRLFDYIDTELAGEPQREMEHHLERCRSCFSRLEFEKRTQGAYRRSGTRAGQRGPRAPRSHLARLFQVLTDGLRRFPQ